MYDEELIDPTRRLELLDSSSSIDHLLAGTRIGKNAFAGIVPVYDTHLFNRRGRQKVSVLWGEQVIDGIKHDSAELVRGALGYPFSNAEERLEAAGPAGAPFSFANAAIFTQEQMDRVVDDLRLRTREANAKTKRFVSDSEWVDIDQALGETGTYAGVFMSKATSGDTGLHIAMILGRLRAAQVIMELVQRIGQLEEDNSRRGPGARRLTGEEKACLAQQERVVKKANEYRLFGHGLACYFVDRLADWLALQEEERACEIEGRDMHPAAKRELRLCEVMRSYLEQCEAVRDRDQTAGGGGDLLPPLPQEELDSKAERFTGIVTPRRRARGAGGGGRGGDDWGKNQAARGPISGELKASLASRMGVCMAATSRSEEPSSRGRDDANRAAGAAATTLEFDVRSKSGTTTEGPRGGGYYGGADGDESMPPPFQGRSLMSAAWVSKSEEPGAAGRRGHPRYATKGLTPGSWTATDRSPSNPVDGETREEGAGAGERG
ncbi:unnamed protein product, partial [Scytosiphon promiscuus]